MNNGTITAKQYRFCQEYIIDLNATQAAIRAGYSKKAAKEQGSRLLANVHVSKRVEELQRDVAKCLGIDARYVLDNLKEVVDRCMAATPVLDHDGNETGEFVFAHQGATKALELIGKHLSLWNGDNKEQNGNGTVIQNYGPTLILAGPREDFVDDGTVGEAD